MSEPVERIGHGEREQAVEALKTHYAQGRLNSQEYEDRSVTARQARTWGDIAPLFTDLPEPHPAPGATVPPLASSAPSGSSVPSAGTAPVAGPSGVQPAAQYGSLVPEPYATWAMSLIPLLAVVMFVVTSNWVWFLAIPIAGVVIYGPGGKHGGRGRDRRRDRRRLEP